MKRALVLGAFSFIGYSVIQKLMAEEVEVLAFDVEGLQHLSKWNEEKMLLIGRNSQFSYRSLCEENIWRETEAQQDIDVVYFCLCEPNQTAAFSPSIHSYLRQTLRLCEQKKKRFVLLSSVCAEQVKQDEASECNNCHFFYELEKQVSSFENSVILRVPTVYGPWQPSFMVYQQLIEAELRKQPIRIHVHECIEDAVYIEDVTACLFACGQSTKHGTFYIESKEKKVWERGITLLRGNDLITISKQNTQENRGNNEFWEYSPQFSIEYGLQKQQQHVQQYKSLYESTGK